MNAQIKRNSNNFSFIDLAGNAITNPRFNDGKDKLKEGKTTDTTYLWVALSAAAQDIGETIYQNVLNYIDLASNVDLCKISALKSMFAQHGLAYKIFENMQSIPIEIENMLDILSINKKYLLDPEVLDSKLIDEIKLCTQVSVDTSPSDYAEVQYRNIKHTLSIDAYDLQDSDFIPEADEILGEYILRDDFVYNDKYDNGTSRKHEIISANYDSYSLLPQNIIHVYKEFINKSTLSVVEDADSQTSSYFVIRKYIFSDMYDKGERACTYGLFRDVDECKDGETKKLIASLVGELGNIETILTHDTDFEADIKTAFDYRRNFEYSGVLSGLEEAEITRFYSKHQFNTDFLMRNTNRNLYVKAIHLFDLSYDNTYIDPDKWQEWLTQRYYQQLSDVCYMHYLKDGIQDFNDDSTAIYNALREELTATQELSVTKDLSSDTRLKKLLYNVEYTFNEKTIADDIESGKDNIDNYVGIKKELIENELNFRNTALSTNYNDWTTRTSYYRTEKVRQYFKFIQDTIFYAMQNVDDINYKLDSNYFEISQQDSYKKLISDTDDLPDLVMIKFVAKKLAQITLYIANARESIKIQAQKNYMKGTFNLLSYMINEYLFQLGRFSSIFNNIDCLIQPRIMSCEISSASQTLPDKHGFCTIGEYTIPYSNILSSTTKKIDNGMSIFTVSAVPDVDIALQSYMLSSVDQYKAALKAGKIKFSKISANYDAAYEYLKEIKNKLSSHLYDDVGIVEYDDITEYYNIQTETSEKSKYKSNLNNQFWNDTTSINTNTNFAFSDSEISAFYCKILNLAPEFGSNDDFQEFLSAIYSTGASKAYIDKDGKLAINSETEVVNGQVVPKDIDAHTKLFLKFNGQDIAYAPYYNIKNKTHSSYQIHPYLYNFIRASNMISPIKNGFMGVIAKQAIEDSVKSQLKTNIGKFGNIINVWKNNSYDYSGYMSRWESSSHSTASSVKTCPVVDYEGIFYPPAISDFLKLSAFSLSTLMYPEAEKNYELSNYGVSTAALNNASKYVQLSDDTFYHKYYDHLNLSKIDREKVRCQLSVYAPVLKTIANKPLSAEDMLYDIYKYGTDMYGNNYILLKDYAPIINYRTQQDGDYTLTYADKENTLGQLFIRLKDHPIAFPAFNGEYCVINKEIMNGALSNVLGDGSNYGDKIFYDMEFDTSKRLLILNAYQGNSYIDDAHMSELLQSDGYKRKEQSLLLLCSIELSTYSKTNETKLIFNHNNKNESKYDCISSLYGINSIDDEHKNVISYLGCVKSATTISPIYLVKTINKIEPNLQSKCLSLLAADYSPRNGIYSTLSSEIDLNTYSKMKDYYYGNDIKMAYTDNVMTLALLATVSSFNATTYFGKIENVSAESIVPAVCVPDDAEQDNDDGSSSFDSLQQNIVLLDVIKTNESMELDGTPQIYNLNADASYLPLYPNENGQLNVYKSAVFSDAKYQLIQLLGRESDIDEKIEQTNPNADFNFDQAELTANLSGRIYEDANINELKDLLDRTLQITTNNETLRIQTLPTQLSSQNGKTKTWAIWSKTIPTIPLSAAKYTYCVFANKNTTAKNMYFAGSAVDLSAAAATIALSKQINYNSTAEVHEHKIQTDAADIKVTGTYNYYDQKLNVSDTNNIPNVSNMRICLTNRGSSGFNTLNVFFELQSNSTPSFVENDVFQFITYNSHIFKVYECCHMLDEAGIYKYSPSDGKYYMLEYDRTGNVQSSTELTGSLARGLSTIRFEDYETLDDIPSLSGYVKNFSFKLDENAIFNIDDPNFYFPGYNKNFPTFIGNIISANAVANDTKGMFTSKNYFILKVDDPAKIADLIGKVDIPVGKYDSHCLRVYEDYDPTKYASNDVQNVEYVKFSTNEEFFKYVYNYEYDKDGNSVGIIFDKFNVVPGANIDFDLYRFQKFGLLHTTTEALKKDHTMDFIRIEVSSKNTDLDDLLNIYINYKVEENGKITLYFNYYNYVNSPFVKFKDNSKLKLYTVPRTYLKLAAGENGLLDIDVQFNVYQGKELRGTKIGNILTYRIYNVSDDKPKFVIQKVKQIKPDSLVASIDLLETYLIVKEMFVSLDDEDIKNGDRITYDQEIVLNSTKEIMPGMVFYLYFNTNELEYMPNLPHSAGIEVEEIFDDDPTSSSASQREPTGILKVTTTAYMSNNTMFVPFKTILTKKQIVDNYVNTYEVELNEIDGTTSSGESIDPLVSPGGVTFGYETVLRKESPDENELVLLEDRRRILMKDRQFENN